MLDIKRIREKTEEVRQGLRDRDADPALVDKVLEFDARRREILTVSEEL
jgi:seryl-tRNA synthetase